jgi:hypothetical protein
MTLSRQGRVNAGGGSASACDVGDDGANAFAKLKTIPSPFLLWPSRPDIRAQRSIGESGLSAAIFRIAVSVKDQRLTPGTRRMGFIPSLPRPRDRSARKGEKTRRINPLKRPQTALSNERQLSALKDVFRAISGLWRRLKRPVNRARGSACRLAFASATRHRARRKPTSDFRHWRDTLGWSYVRTLCSDPSK